MKRLCLLCIETIFSQMFWKMCKHFEIWRTCFAFTKYHFDFGFAMTFLVLVFKGSDVINKILLEHINAPIANNFVISFLHIYLLHFNCCSNYTIHQIINKVGFTKNIYIFKKCWWRSSWFWQWARFIKFFNFFR